MDGANNFIAEHRDDGYEYEIIRSDTAEMGMTTFNPPSNTYKVSVEPGKGILWVGGNGYDKGIADISGGWDCIGEGGVKIVYIGRKKKK